MLQNVTFRNRHRRGRWIHRIASAILLAASCGCATSPRDLMTSWVTSLEWFHPEYAGTAKRYEELQDAWRKEQIASETIDQAQRLR